MSNLDDRLTLQGVRILLEVNPAGVFSRDDGVRDCDLNL